MPAHNHLSGDGPAPNDALLEELRSYQAELELQNEQLRAANEQIAAGFDALTLLYDLTPVAIVTIDRYGVVRQANRCAESLLGGSAGRRVVERHMIGFLAEPDRGLMVEACASAFAGQPFRSREASTIDGRRLRIEGALCPRLAPDIAACGPGLLVVCSDITERHEQGLALARAKQLAEAASVAKSQFLSTMSHEIRTPLNGIVGLLSMYRDMELPDDLREGFGLILGCADDLLEIINECLDFARIDQRKVVLERIPFDLPSTIREAAARHALTASAKGLSLEVRIAEPLAGRCLGDPVRLRQIVGNLVANAVKFTDRGSVTVEAWLAEDTLRISVADTGIGIPPEALSRIFQPFSQADMSTTRRFGGSGLGLAICLELTELMGGRITVESSPGAGSRFTAVLPPFPAASLDEPAQAPGPDLGWPGRRVLVVDDSPIGRTVASGLANRLGLVSATACDGRDALTRLAIENYDVVLMDCSMPEIDGMQATRELRRRELVGGTRVAVLALSAHIGPEIEAACAEAGMDGYLAKPVTREALFKALHGPLGAPQEMR